MKIAGLKTVHDPPVGLVQPSGLASHRPITRKGPLIEPQLRRSPIDPTLVQYCPTGRDKILGAVIADIVLRRSQAVPIGGSFNTTALDRNGFIPNAAASGLGQQLLNNLFRLLVFTFAELMMANLSLGINEIEGRPIVIVESPPDGIVVINHDRIFDPQFLRGSAHVS